MKKNQDAERNNLALYLFHEGTNYKTYEYLGSHKLEQDGKEGVVFRTWAPNAAKISVVGEFNGWDEKKDPMERISEGGVWQCFIPDKVKEYDVYRYAVTTQDGEVLMKADPYAYHYETRPSNASKFYSLDGYEWNDNAWYQYKAKHSHYTNPVNIYEVHAGSWRKFADGNPFSYEKFADELIPYVKEMGYTHIELMPMTEYPYDGSWGYQVTGYFAPTARYGDPKEFMRFVDRCHQAGISVIMDWVPAHFPRDIHGLAKFDGTCCYEYADPRKGEHKDWGTLVFDYGRNEVISFLISSAVFWLEKYHIDGIRCDAVASMLYLDYGRNPGEWTPNIYGTNENLDALEFLKHLNSVIKERNPGLLLVAQENGLWPELTDSVENDHLGFDYKWSGGWTKDLLEYLSKDPIERKNYHDQLTMSMLYAYCEHYILTLGSRDVGTLKDFADKLPGSEEQKNAQIREAYAYMMLHPGCKMMAPDKDMPKELEVFVKDLNNMYLAHPALYQLDDEYDGFEWVQLMKYEENVIAFMRKTEKPEETVLAVCNFAAIPYENYNVGVPFAGKYKEIFNSDDKKYGGNGVVNTRVKAAKKAECDEREYSITVKLPALGVAVFTCTPEEIEKKPAAEHSQIKKSITKTRTVRKAAGKTKAAVKTAVKPVTKKVTKEAPQIVNKTEEKIPVKKDLTEKK